MDPAHLIHEFLDRVRHYRTRVNLLSGTYLILFLLVAGGLAANLLAYFLKDPGPWLIPFLAVWSLPLLYLLGRTYIAEWFLRLRRDQAALLVEEKVRHLNNNLINSIQLEPQLKEERPDGISREMIVELLARTQKDIRDLRPEDIVSTDRIKHTRRALVGSLAILLVAALSLPDFWTRGYEHWVAPPPEAGPIKQVSGSPDSSGSNQPEFEYAIESMTLEFNYPAYTQLKRITLNNADGKIKVLPGTEVNVTARTNHPVAGASLVLNNRDNLSMDALDDHRIRGRFIVKEGGFYQFRLKSPDGHKVLLPTRYPIELGQDRAPRIIMFLSNPKPVYMVTDKIQFYYEAVDDFGLSRVNLVMDVDGQVTRRTIKRFKSNEKENKDGFTWELATMALEPGNRVQYYLEVEDNDNVYGPNTGQSEVYSFEIFDERQKRWDLLALQDELVDKMVTLLAKTLVSNTEPLADKPEDLTRYKKTLAWTTDRLIEIINLAQTIQTQAREVESFPKPYLTLMGNIIGGLNEIREDQIQAMNQINNALFKTTPIAFNAPPGGPVMERLITHLERDILFLVKLLNRERMNQVMDLDRELGNLAENLREEFEKLKDKNSPKSTSEFKKAMDKIRETLHKIMEQLSRQMQGLPDEFLNKQAFENMSLENMNASMEKIKDLVEQGKIEEAMQEMEKFMDDLRAFSENLDNMNQNQENMVDLELMKQIDDSLQKIDELAEQQKGLLDETMDINKNLRSQQLKMFEQQLKDFFESLKKDVNAIQGILREDERVLETNPDMQKLVELMDKEDAISSDIRDLNEKTLGSLGREEEHRESFAKLKDKRAELADIMDRIHSLHMKMFHGFKNYLPELNSKYDKLEEFTEIQDLFEFNSMFRQTYPDVLRWQNHFRTSRDLNPELLDRMNDDLYEVAQLNSEISKKLGTMMRSLQQNYQSLLNDEEKQQLQRMAKQQEGLSKETEELSELFQQMNRKNPMISPGLSNRMTGTGRYMKQSQSRLKDQRVQDSIESENRALQGLNEVRDMLEALKNSGQGQGQPKSSLQMGQGRQRDPRQGGGARRLRQEKITLPSEDQYRVPGQFREDIIEAMKNKYPEKYERLIGQYYKELVK
ncbi:membrane hypothetical protein [Nitrospina gracilis 3/211]|uniref:DUF4175 domain-containing protein n=1 Tax=Nitrospina gracilis (strain 3/211) TaxID=1266370 RepID=M1Z1I3_NITG3|nr:MULTISPECIES: DUF4175 family protein [Nitrospina]MCF8724675.1 hypothetical protein [Nitrospina sp. Nb-3]CCQ91858.1 membrane hypothetical protein [Nitrospina gracilis 3/211]